MAEFFPENIRTRPGIARVLALVLVGSIVFGSLIRSGSLSFASGTSAWQTIIPLGIFIYVLVISVLNLLGFKLDISDLIIIPTLGTGLIFVLLNSVVQPSYTPEDVEGVSTTATDEVVLSSTTTTTTGTNGTTVDVESTFVFQDTRVVDRLLDPAQILFIAFLSITIGIILLYFYSRLSDDRLRVNLMEKDLYSKSFSANQKTIFEIYVKSSHEIEKVYGNAPRWYSPSFFSEELVTKTTEALASYFTILTQLYEKARFSEMEVTSKDVSEAEELMKQILLGLEQYLKELEEANK